MKQQSKWATSNPKFLGTPRSHDNSDAAGQQISVTPTSSGRSETIPLPSSHVHRTQSELQLSEDMEAAERRDISMFYRLITGIRHRQMNRVQNGDSQFSNPISSLESDRSIASIINTRNTPIELSVPVLQTADSMRGSADAPVPVRYDQDSLASAMLHSRLFPSNALEETNCLDDWSVSGFPDTVTLGLDQASCGHPFPQRPDNRRDSRHDAEEEEEIFHLDM